MGTLTTKDFDALNHILRYCVQIVQTSNEFSNSKEKFFESATFRNAICLCILQIGELVTILSDDFKANNTTIPWREIKLLRNIVAHRYGYIDFEIIWDILLEDIPEIMRFCTELINEHRQFSEQ